MRGKYLVLPVQLALSLCLLSACVTFYQGHYRLPADAAASDEWYGALIEDVRVIASAAGLEHAYRRNSNNYSIIGFERGDGGRGCSIMMRSDIPAIYVTDYSSLAETSCVSIRRDLEALFSERYGAGTVVFVRDRFGGPS